VQKRSEHSLFRAVGWWGNVLIFIAAAWQLVLLVTLVYVRYGTMGEDRAGHTFPLFMLVWSSLVITVPASAVALMKASYAWGDQIGATWFYFSVAALPLLVFSAFFLL
jgi:hypothetical protein